MQRGFYGNVLQAAASSGSVTTVKLLLKAGAEVNAQGGFAGTALQAAKSSLFDITNVWEAMASDKFEDVIAVLSAAGADD
jgi:hypothetical protein